MWYLIGVLVLAFVAYEVWAIRTHGRPRLTGITEGWGRDTRAAARTVRALLTRGR